MKLNRIIILIIITIFVLPIVSFASETNGTINSINKYAWSNKSGWINFRTTNGDIKISDSGITGYAWNSNYGWINMSPTNGGVKIATSGSLSGYAWGANMGWINFSGVSINSSGKFVGSATGKIVGTLTFDCSNCNVSTDYRPKNFRTSTQTSFNVSSNNQGRVLSPDVIPTTIVSKQANTIIKKQKSTHTSSGVSAKTGSPPISNSDTPKVLPSEQFGIRLLLDKSSVTKSENIVSRVTFGSFGRVQTPVNMLFSITDKNGKIIWKKDATTTVQIEGVYTKRLPVLNLSVGKYILNLHTKYNKDIEDNFSVSFQIISKARMLNWISWSIGILAILIFIFFIIKFVRDKRRVMLSQKVYKSS